MYSTKIRKLKNRLTKEFPLRNPDAIMHAAMPIYPDRKGYYIWYRDSVPEFIDTSIVSEEHELLYQSEDLTEHKPWLNMYVLVYSFCLTVAILILLFSPLLPDAFATSKTGNSSVNTNDANYQFTPLEQLSEIKPKVETVHGNGLYTQKNHQIEGDSVKAGERPQDMYFFLYERKKMKFQKLNFVN